MPPFRRPGQPPTAFDLHQLVPVAIGLTEQAIPRHLHDPHLFMHDHVLPMMTIHGPAVAVPGPAAMYHHFHTLGEHAGLVYNLEDYRLYAPSRDDIFHHTRTAQLNELPVVPLADVDVDLGRRVYVNDLIGPILGQMANQNLQLPFDIPWDPAPEHLVGVLADLEEHIDDHIPPADLNEDPVGYPYMYPEGPVPMGAPALHIYAPPYTAGFGWQPAELVPYAEPRLDLPPQPHRVLPIPEEYLQPPLPQHYLGFNAFNVAPWNRPGYVPPPPHRLPPLDPFGQAALTAGLMARGYSP